MRCSTRARVLNKSVVVRTKGQAVLQGVPFRGVQVLRWKRLILLHEENGPENRKHEVNFPPPSVAAPDALIKGTHQQIYQRRTRKRD